MLSCDKKGHKIVWSRIFLFFNNKGWKMNILMFTNVIVRLIKTSLDSISLVTIKHCSFLKNLTHPMGIARIYYCFLSGASFQLIPYGQEQTPQTWQEIFVINSGGHGRQRVRRRFPYLKWKSVSSGGECTYRSAA